LSLLKSRTKYLGVEATGYEDQRAHKIPWQQEQDAVELLVNNGPVLDIPVGTGRYAEIYASKGLSAQGLDVSPDMISIAQSRGIPSSHGSIFDIPAPDKTYKISVCTRLLNWLEPTEIKRAIGELLRVSECSVISIRLGQEPWRGATVTHTWADLISALGSVWITDRVMLRDEGDAGIYWMLKIKRPTMDDVRAQFRWNRGGEDAFERLHYEWCDRYGIEHFVPESVRVEWISGKEIWLAVKRMSLVEPGLTAPNTKLPPRHDDLPITWVEYGDNMGQLDGRHRAYKWRKDDALHPVFICSRS
jgi:hypothetical protein